MVQFAQELEMKRTRIFQPLRLYEEILNDFLNTKRAYVSDQGKFVIENVGPAGRLGLLHWRNLSSGEKQILILLTQAILWVKSPVVYVADEPELSLHVVWQEKLLSSLVRLAGQCQFIVATHSPDVVGTFSSKLIDLNKLSGSY